MVRFWMVDTFAASVFEGNLASVCLLDRELAPSTLQKIAREFNTHETVFLSPLQNQHFQTQIFTPLGRESVCGHGLIAAAHVLWNELNLENLDAETLYFDTNFGIFMVTRPSKESEEALEGKAPLAETPVPSVFHKNAKLITLHAGVRMAEPTAVPDRLINALGTPPIAVSKCGPIYVVEMFNPKQVLKLEPDIAKLEKVPCNGVVVTAEGGQDVPYDFMSRFFAPNEGMKEDAVTLWNHCFLGPYWANRLGRTSFVAMQTACGRTGLLHLDVIGEQIKITGEGVTSMRGELCGISNWALKPDLFEGAED